MVALMKRITIKSEKRRRKDAQRLARSEGNRVFVSSSFRPVCQPRAFSAARTFHLAGEIQVFEWTVTDTAEMASGLHKRRSRMHDPGACLVISSSPETVLLILPMNKQLRNAICLTLVSASGLSLARAQDGSPVTGSGAPATLMAVTVAPTVGAVVVEASTNLVD